MSRATSRPGLLALALLVVAFTGAPASATPFSATVPTQVSGASPFDPGCGLTADGGTVFIQSEVEPWVDVSPVDPDIVAAIWQQDRWSNGGARGNAGAISFDGGTTWDHITFPGTSECVGGDFQRGTDPWLSFAPNGDLHIMHLVLDITPPPGRPGGFGKNGMMVQKIAASDLADGDVDESELSDPILIAFADNGDLHDKNAITADPTDSDFVYAVWDFLDIPEGAFIRPDRAVAIGFKGAALFSRSTDGGETWSEPTVLYNPGGVNQTIGNQIVVGPDGTLFNFFSEILNFRNDDRGNQFEFNVSMKLSRNKGVTWLPQGRPIRIAKLVRASVVDPDTGEPHRTQDFQADVAVDPNSGNLYAAWQDRRFTGRSAIAFTMSADGGRAWTAPIMINQTPLTGTANDQAFLPSVHVSADGTVGVTYYDFRNNVIGVGGTDTDHWFVHCHAGCASTAGWVGNETRVTAASFDARQAPVTGSGFFLGDYMGLSSFGTTFTPFYTEGVSPADPSSEFYAEVGP